MILKKFYNSREIIKYGVVGIFNTACGLSIIYFLMFFGKISPYISNFLSYCICFVISFLLHSKFTFSQKNIKIKKIISFSATVAMSVVSNMGVLFLSIEILRFDEYFSQLLGLSTYVIVHFTLLKIFVYNS